MSLRNSSLLVEGARLYNAVPQDISEYKGSYLGFINLLDEWLQQIPDYPRVVGYEPLARKCKGRPSNSIRDWSNKLHLDNWQPDTTNTFV